MIYGKYIAALCMPRIHDATNHKFIVSLSESLVARNFRLLVYSTPSDMYWKSIDEQGEKTVFSLINYDITDVVIVHDEIIKNKDVVRSIIDAAKSHNKPVITIGDHYDGCANVKFDYCKGFEQMVRHVLKDHGITDFHHIAGIKGNQFSEERTEIVRKVAAELDIPFGDEDISYGQFWSQPTEEAVEALFVRRRRLPQALICANDAMAITAINVLKKHNIRIPEDIIVTGFDGINEIKYCVPRVTTCLCNNEQLAGRVAEMVERYVKGEAVQEHEFVTPVLQKSESCGCVNTTRINPSEELTYINNSFFRFQSEEEHMFRMMSRIIGCESYTEAVGIMDQYDFYDMVIALNPECTDPTVNPLSQTSDSGFGETVKLIYNTNHPLNGRIEEMHTMELHPNLKEMLTEYEAPLIFYSLNYMGTTIGYICFNYQNYDIQNYYKASQTVNTLNSAFGAFRAMKYQHYLSEKIEEMYRCDSLTHLLNRMALRNSYPDLLEKSRGKLTVVFADLDDLKTINDKYGHDDGDFAICSVADALKTSCPDEALCVRWGGDEMVAVIPGDHSSGTIHDDINAYLQRINAESGKEYVISTSVGVMTFDVDSSTEFEDMVRAADQLMYREKNRKKERRKVTL